MFTAIFFIGSSITVPGRGVPGRSFFAGDGSNRQHPGNWLGLVGLSNTTLKLSFILVDVFCSVYGYFRYKRPLCTNSETSPAGHQMVLRVL